MINKKVIVILLDQYSWYFIKMAEYFHKQFSRFNGNVKVELELPRYSTGVDIT